MTVRWRGAVLFTLLAGCVAEPSAMTEPSGITHTPGGVAARGETAADSARRAVRNLQKQLITYGDHHLEFRWRFPEDTVGLVGYEYHLHDRRYPSPERWEPSGSVPDGEFRPCRTKPDWLIRTTWQFTKCSHGSPGAVRNTRPTEYHPLHWTRLYHFRVRAVYSDGTRGPVAEVLSVRPRKPENNTGGGGGTGPNTPGNPGPTPPTPPGGPGTPGGPTPPGGANDTCSAFIADLRESGTLSYDGECHDEDWDYFTVDATSLGARPLLVGWQGEGYNAICGHDGVSRPWPHMTTMNLYCSPLVPSEWVSF